MSTYADRLAGIGAEADAALAQTGADLPAPVPREPTYT